MIIVFNSRGSHERCKTGSARRPADARQGVAGHRVAVPHRHCIRLQAAQAQEFATAATDVRPRQLALLPGQDVDQVDPRNGNLVIRHRELVLPGNGGLDITVWRTYDMSSASAGLGMTHSQSFRWTALGPGWSLGVAPRIVFDRHYTVQGSTPVYQESSFLRMCRNQDASHYNFAPNLPVLELPNGERHELYIAGGGKALAKNGWKVECRATRSAPLAGRCHIRLRRCSGGTAHRQILNRRASPAQPLPPRSSHYLPAKSLRDRNGNTLTFQYKEFGDTRSPNVGYAVRADDAAAFERPSALLAAVVASDGRRVTFAYDEQTGRLVSMTDHLGRAWRYGYQNPDSQNSRVLTQVTLPTGLTWSYAYAPGAFKVAPFGSPTYAGVDIPPSVHAS